jgi:hypothetical protein
MLAAPPQGTQAHVLFAARAEWKVSHSLCSREDMPMHRTLFSALLLAMALVFTGCAASSSDSGNASADPAATREFYYEEFNDVSIPLDMEVSKGDTFVTYSSGGVKVGIQLFKGRLEMGSLIAAMQRYMQRDGWSLRSVFRAQRAILIFEKPEKICTLFIEDGMITTSMLVFISPNLSDGNLHYSGAAGRSPGGVQTYPAGGFSNPGQGGQALSQ